LFGSTVVYHNPWRGLTVEWDKHVMGESWWFDYQETYELKRNRNVAHVHLVRDNFQNQFMVFASVGPEMYCYKRCYESTYRTSNYQRAINHMNQEQSRLEEIIGATEDG